MSDDVDLAPEDEIVCDPAVCACEGHEDDDGGSGYNPRYQVAVWSGHHMLDPSELESRFAVEDGMAYLDSVFEDPTDESLALIERITDIMEFLPPREADFVELYFFRRLKQTDIAAIFGVSQPTVCYRLQRATARIKFLLALPPIKKADLQKDMRGFLSDQRDAEIMCLMFETTCQSEVAKRLGVSQGLVRHRFIRSLTRMRPSKKLSKYVEVFDVIAANLNILREVQRPSWDNRVTHVLG
jgi:RNA polymerase sigma factor (sigma-70 family)